MVSPKQECRGPDCVVGDITAGAAIYGHFRAALHSQGHEIRIPGHQEIDGGAKLGEAAEKCGTDPVDGLGGKQPFAPALWQKGEERPKEIGPHDGSSMVSIQMDK